MADKAGQGLANRLKSARETDLFDVNVFLETETAQSALAGVADTDADMDPGSRVDAIKSGVQATQQPLLDYLAQAAGQPDLAIDADVAVPHVLRAESFWINNAVGTEVSLATLRTILDRGDVAHVELAHYAQLAELVDGGRRGRAVPAVVRAGDFTRSGLVRFKALADSAAPPTWSVTRVNAPLLWQKGITGKGILVAVVDSGVNYRHPDLRNRMWNGGAPFPRHGWDFASNDSDPNDEMGHGTSCAGIVAGDGTAGRATGVAPAASIVAIRVGGAERTFWRGLQFAIDRQVQVISMSMTWKYPSSPDYPGWRRVCESILAAGILHANSIGNQGDDLVTYPLPYNIATPGNCPPPWLNPLQSPAAGLSSAIACGATDDADRLASYSGRGPAAWEQQAPYTDYPYASGQKKALLKPDICAPGPGTTSCNWRYQQDTGATAYSSFGGTSSATPHVGGCLALLAHACRRANKPIVPARVQEALEKTAVRVAGQTAAKQNHYGAGRVDVFAAYTYGVSKGWWS